MESPIGFIGIGIMGKGMIKNLVLKLGVDIIVWNRNPTPSKEVAEAFPGKIDIASSPKDVVSKCKITFSMLSNLEASISVFDGSDGAIEGVSDGKIIVDCATLTPERMIEESQKITAAGGKFVEAPVSGSKVPADMGQLIFICGGDEAAYNEVSAGLDAMGKAKFFLGPVGAGSRMKLVVNMIMGAMTGAFAEGLALCDATDLSSNALLQILDLGAMSNPLFRGKGPNMIGKKYEPHFPLKHAHKDMRYGLSLASVAGVSLPVMSAATDSMASVLEKHGDDDFCAVREAYPGK